MPGRRTQWKINWEFDKTFITFPEHQPKLIYSNRLPKGLVPTNMNTQINAHPAPAPILFPFEGFTGGIVGKVKFGR